MFVIRVAVTTLILYFIFNFKKIKQKKAFFDLHSLILPFSISFAITFVDLFLKAAFIYSFLSLLIIWGACYGLCYLAGNRFLKKIQ